MKKLILIAVVIFLSSCDNKEKAKPYFDRGVELVKMKDFNGGVKEFDEAINIYPNYYEAYQQRGLAKIELEDYHEAIIDFDKAIELNPNNTIYYLNKGEAEGHLKGKALINSVAN